MNQAVKNLIEQWSGHLSVSPYLLLDGTWPSLSIIDSLTFGLRAEPDVPPALEPMLHGAAAYIAEIVASCWREFCSSVEVIEGSEGIELRGKGGEHFANAELMFPIEQEFRKMLLDVPTSFELFYDTAIPIQIDSNIVHHFTLSVASGLSPLLRGRSYDERSLDAPWFEGVQKQIARQTATNYQRLFPSEAIGQMAEMYLGTLLCPPPLVGEPLPLINAVTNFCEMSKEYGFDVATIERFASCLVRSPDENCSSLGLILLGAITQNRPSAQIIAVAQRKGSFVGLLRTAMVAARELLLKREDWLVRGLQTPEQLSHFKVEAALGFIPWVQFPSNLLKDANYFSSVEEVIRSAIEFDLQSAMAQADKIIEQDPSNLALRIQRARFDIVAGDFEHANQIFSNLLSEPGVSQLADFHNLWGLVRLEIGKVREAKSSFMRGLRTAEGDDDFVAEINNNIAWCYMLEQEFSKASEFLDLAIQGADCPLTALLNRIMVCWKLGEFQQVPVLRQELFDVSPFDRRVFANLTLSAETIEQLLH